MNYYKKDIIHEKGTTYAFGIIVEDLGQELDGIYFTCRDSLNDDSEVVFEKNLDNGITLTEYNEDDDIRKYIIRIAPEDTAELQSGTYYYGLSVEVNGDIFTVQKGKFILEQKNRKEEI